MVTDPISDMITQVRNASRVGKPQVVVSFSNLKLALANVLKKEGYLKNVARNSRFSRNYITLDIAYNDKGESKILEIERVSKPSRRIYRKADEIHTVRQGRGISIISTPKGLLTDKEARQARLGGELMCKVW